nr:MAG: hypothetical protein [Bacteriophage sp.]
MIARGGGCALIACGGGCALIACGGGCAPIACGGGCALIARGMILFFGVCALDRIVKSDLALYIFDLRFHEAGNANLSFQRHFPRNNLAIR